MEKKNLLALIQAELHAPKGQKNTFGNYNYRSAEDILKALKPILEKIGGSIVIDEEIKAIGDRVYIQSTATLYNSENEPVRFATAFARESLSRKGMDDAQLTGATSSYAKKYALGNLFAIDNTKDADATNQHGKGKKEDTEQNAPSLVEQMDACKSVEVLGEWFKKLDKTRQKAMSDRVTAKKAELQEAKK